MRKVKEFILFVLSFLDEMASFLFTKKNPLYWLLYLVGKFAGDQYEKAKLKAELIRQKAINIKKMMNFEKAKQVSKEAWGEFAKKYKFKLKKQKREDE